MSTQEFKRKLTTILSADVVGYSRLMGDDEAATVKTLEHYKAIMSDLIRQHRGRVVDSPGDNLLAEFTSVVDAVQCAVAAQKEFQAQNAELPEDRRMRFRIGVNLGDVIEEDGRIYGDGVNIAARLESLADPGGVCISKTAFDQIETKLPLGYQYIGEQTVKNITKPVESYKVVMEPRVTGTDRKGQSKWALVWCRKSVLSGAIAVLIVIIGAGVWNFYWRAPKIEPASKEKMAFQLPDKPSIAVLPFINMSEDPKQEFLCDGISDEIITALSKVPGLFVVARNSTFTYKGKPVKVKQVSEELGVHYVLEGSVQRSSDRIRINAQLIDALSGDHLWADSYDRELKDIFVLQDEITMKVLTSVQDKLTLGTEILRSQKYAEKYFRGQQGLDCYLKIMEGNNYVEHRNIKDNNLAQRIADEVLVKCSDVPMAYILMANVHFLNYFLGLSNPQESIDKGIEMAEKAISMDDTLAEAHGILGGLYTQNREYDKGISEGERAVKLNPGGASVLGNYAMSLNFSGRSNDAIPLLQKAIRLNPYGSPLIYMQLANAFLFTGRYEDAVPIYKKAIQLAPNFQWNHVMLAAAYIELGREKEARDEAAEVLTINPNFSLDYYLKIAVLKDEKMKKKVYNALLKAGLK